MKVRSLKQVLHWLFLIVGTFSICMLAFSTATYLDYARDGYGLEVTVKDTWINEGRLFLRLQVVNPGGMDLILGPLANLTVTETSTSYISNGLVKADNTTVLIISFDLGQTDLEMIRDTGLASFSLNIEVTVNERDAVTNLHLEVTDQEVRA